MFASHRLQPDFERLADDRADAGRSQRVLLESLQVVADRGTRNLSRVGGER